MIDHLMDGNILSRYRSTFPDIPGWFPVEAMVAWEFFFRAQEHLGIRGDFFEIGVYKGRSAVLGSMYMRPEEWCVLLDIKPIPEAAAMIQSFRPKRNKYIQCLSNAASDLTEVQKHFGRCRWVHIDGDHQGKSVSNDLALAEELIKEDGLICLDDFFNYRYPQLTAAVYRFLFAREPKFQIVFAGSKKCYICHSNMYRLYDEIIRNQFVAIIEEHGLNLQLNRSSYASDGGCFTASLREGERFFRGLDGDAERMVF